MKPFLQNFPSKKHLLKNNSNQKYMLIFLHKKHNHLQVWINKKVD